MHESRTCIKLHNCEFIFYSFLPPQVVLMRPAYPLVVGKRGFPVVPERYPILYKIIFNDSGI